MSWCLARLGSKIRATSRRGGPGGADARGNDGRPAPAALIFVAVVLAAPSAHAIVCGETARASIETNSNVDTYPFSAASGDVVSVSVGERPGGTSTFNPVWRLFGPGLPMAGFPAGGCSSQCPSPALAGGSYGIQISDSGSNGTGPYAATMEAVSDSLNGAACGSPLSCGATATATLDVQGDTDSFTFLGEVGDVVTLKVSDDNTPDMTIGSLEESWELYAPDGSRVLVNTATETGLTQCLWPRFDCTSDPLPAAGVYTIRVFDIGDPDTGPYDVTLEVVSGSINGGSNGPPSPICGVAPDGTQAIACGETISNAIDVRSDTDSYTFLGEVGDVVTVTVSNDSGLWGTSIGLEESWELYAPDGSRVLVNTVTETGLTQCLWSRFQCTSDPLPAAGVYTIRVFDIRASGVASDLDVEPDTGPYDITLEAVSGSINGGSNGPPSPICGVAPDGTQAIACGETISNAIDVPSDTDSYTFLGKVGDIVTVTVSNDDVTDGPLEKSWELYSPDGSRVLVNTATETGLKQCRRGFQCTSDPLPAAGVYTITVFGSHSDMGPYDVTLSGSCNGRCNNGVDDDRDGKIDFPADDGCKSADDLSERPECGDGRDNDRDGFVDAPSDLGCADANSPFEDPRCEDGINNDFDLFIDWDGSGVTDPDPQCTAAWQTVEGGCNGCNCSGIGPELALLVPLLSLLRSIRRSRSPSELARRT